MAFVSGQQIQVGCTESPAKIEVSSKSDIDTYRICPEYDNLDDLEVHHSWTDVINTAVFELAEAGVAEQYRSGLAAFLCAAYIKKQPLLLVGPNAIDIIQAFSAAVTAHKHGVLCCEGGYAHQAVEKIGADGESIVIINNFLASGWITGFQKYFIKKMFFMCLPTRMQKTFRLNLKACMDSCCHCLQSSWLIKKLLVNTMGATSLTILILFARKRRAQRTISPFEICSEFVS